MLVRPAGVSSRAAATAGDPSGRRPAVLGGLAIFVLGQIFLFAAPRAGGRRAGGTIATASIALAWLSFSYQALLYGAAWVRVRDDAMTDWHAPETEAPGPISPGSSRSGGRTARWPTVTARS